MIRVPSVVAMLMLSSLVRAETGVDASAEGGAQSSSAEPSGGSESDEQVVAFKSTVKRFSDRMREFDDEARSIIERRERDERETLNAGYRGPVDALREEEVALRSNAVARLEEFLVRYPRSSHTAHAMFLLGDLYYEEQEEAFADASEAFEKMFSGDVDLSSMPEAPMRDHGRAVRLFEGIAQSFPDYTNTDGALYMLGFIYQRDETLQGDEDKGRDSYLRLVENYPDSEFAASAHMALGEHYFDNHNIAKAIENYGRVVDLHAPEGQHYENGLYKLAWSHYKLSNYDTALDLLAKLLDWSEEKFMRTGKRSATAPEAVEYTAISLSDISDNTGGDPIDIAKAFYSRIGERVYEPDVYERLADVLMQQTRYRDAIRVYDSMLQRWPNEPKNPTYLWTVASLYRSLDVPDIDASESAITKLNDLFNRDSAWAHANRNNPDALAVADGYIEQSLAQVAIVTHNKAAEAGDQALYSRAADLYTQYLNKFPFAKDYYEIQWYLADTLLKSGRLKEAGVEYVQLLKGKDHPYRDGSMWNLMNVRRKVLVDAYGKIESLPENAVEVERKTSETGQEWSVYALSPEHEAFIESADMLVDAEFQDADYGASLDDARPALLYIPGQIYYYHGRLEEARERLHEVIKRYPGKDEAAFAASLIVDSWQDEGDLAKVRMWAGKFARMSLGATEAAQAKNLNFTNLEEGAAFKMAAQYIEDGKREEAAEAFLAFMTDFPNSQHIKKAHYNAANNFEIIGALERANGLFKDYIDRIESGTYEADDQAWPIYERIAHNYASALELDEAVRYFEMLYQRSGSAAKPYENAPAALYNAGFLRIGLGDNRGAAENLEKYAEENRDQLDAESAMWSAADQWKLVSTDEAKRFYERYLQSWGGTNPDHAIASYYELAKIAEEAGDPRASDAWARVLESYNEFAPGGQLGPLGVHYAAAAAYRPVAAAFAEFQQYEFTSDDNKNATLINEIKKPALYALETQCLELIKAFPDFDYSSAALYTLGASYLSFAKMLFEVPEPADMDEEMLDMYYEALDELRIPVEDKGKARLQAVLEKAEGAKRWSDWTTKTVDFLAQSFPSEFAREVPEIRGVGDSTLLPMAGPMSPVSAVAEPAGSGADQPTPPAAPAGGSSVPEAPPADGGQAPQPGVWQ